MCARTHLLAGAALLALAVAATPVLAGEPALEWIQNIDSQTPGGAFGHVVTVGQDVYVVGSVIDALPGETGLGGQDGFVMKYDADGTRQWIRQFGTTGNDSVRAAAVDGTDLYVVGRTDGQFSPTSSGKAFLAKLTLAGTLEWTLQFGGAGAVNESATGVAVSATTIYVVGTTDGTLPGGLGGNDGFLARLDKSGALLDLEPIGSTDDDSVGGVAVAADGIYVCGHAGDALVPDGTKQGLWGDAFLRKYAFDGSITWTKQFLVPSPGTTLGSVAGPIAVDDTGIYVGGSGTYVSGQVQPLAFARKYTPTGEVTWEYVSEEPREVPRALDVDSGRLYGAGGLLVAFDSATGAVDWIEELASQSVAVGPSALYVSGTTRELLAESREGVPAAPGAFQDVFVRKYDNAGVHQWTRQVGGSSPANNSAHAVDADGNVYVGGWTMGAIEPEPALGGPNAFLRKYDAFGNVIWTRIVETSDYGTGVAVDATGVYLGGESYVEGSSNDLFLAKFTHDGEYVWTAGVGTEAHESCHGVTADATGVYMTGFTYGEIPGANRPFPDAPYNTDAFLLKFDSVSGAVLAADQIGSAANDYGYGVSAGVSGVYVAGVTWGTLPGETAAGGVDAFVARYRIDGTRDWLEQYGTTATDVFNAAHADDTGVLVAGRTSIPFQSEALVCRFDSTGAVEWCRQHGTSAYDLADAIDADEGAIYVGGRTSGTFPGNDRAGGYDAFVLRLEPNGDLTWAFQFGGPADDGVSGLDWGIAGLFVVGNSSSTPPGATTVRSGFVARVVELEPEIELAPSVVAFGQVKVGNSSTAVVTIRNVGTADLEVTGISHGAGTPFSVTAAPAIPFTLEAGAIAYVEVTFAPAATGDFGDTLVIASDDPHRPLVEVGLRGTGSPVEPAEQLAAILAFFDQGVAEGTIVADGPPGLLKACRNMLVAAGSQVDNGNTQGVLAQAYARADGDPNPPDFVTGPAVPELAAMILELIATLEA